MVAESGRCPTCRRWAGVRRVAEDGVSVLLDPAQPRGACTEGPWHGTLRGPRNACGQWVAWLVPPANEDPTKPRATNPA